MPTRQATRVGDLTSHAGVVVNGSADVFVNLRSATRLSDPHVCPMPTPTPHVGGPVMLGQGGALTVLINRKPGTARLMWIVLPLLGAAAAWFGINHK